ncbi:flavin reductase family protein [Streptomyces longisporoflavus]|uniref:Flavin reductase family protein n=1 Tax=Streptomyces longisporoflavus TaxID=28044 RepID=A0ABW7R2P7_9ACTN
MSTPAPLRSGTASQQAFRDVMAAVPSPVAVVTALDGTRPHGATVSAFASLSLTPPMMLVSLDERSHLLAAVRRSGRFGVNVLGAHQADPASVFSRSAPAKSDGIDRSPSGELPRLPDADAWITAEVADRGDAGDHTVLLAHVTAAEPGAGSLRPLT